jgi:hypothetical protein
MLDGEETRVKLCMKCLKRVKKDMNEGKKPFVELVNYKAEPVEAETAQATA